MKTLSTLSVTFDGQIAAYEVPAFRGAIVEKVGRKHDLFHNHDNRSDSSQRFFNRYALVQYKRYRRQPMLLFLGNGVSEAQHFFGQENWELEFNGRIHDLGIANMHAQQYELQVTPNEMRAYRINRYLALNQDNYRAYKKITGLAERIAFIQSKLTGHLIAFAEGIGWQIEERFEAIITSIEKTQTLKYKRNPMLAFDIVFHTTLVLPRFIGLGKGAAAGYGVVYPTRLPDAKETGE